LLARQLVSQHRQALGCFRACCAARSQGWCFYTKCYICQISADEV
jgi:hypothetical protein